MLRQKTHKRQAAKQQFDNLKAKTIDSTKLVTIKSPTYKTVTNSKTTTIFVKERYISLQLQKRQQR